MAILVRRWRLRASAAERARRAQLTETFQTVERRLGRSISWSLRVGVLIAATLVLIGGGIYLTHHGTEVLRYATFEGQPERFTSVRGIFRSVRDLEGRGIILLGLIALVLTPVARVLFSALLFAKQRDWLYLAITAFVLGVLVYGLAGGKL